MPRVLERTTLARIAVAVLLVVATMLTGLPRADAFKPYTHVQTGENARQDVIDDGKVTIEGRDYDVPAPIVDALKNWPSYFNAGVIGPDGFPDLVMGQSIIHPENTGLWLRHIVNAAWAAQDDPSYSADQKGQILAFAYGYMTHAAGDLWMHTMINDFSEGVFPGVRDLLNEPQKAAVALRHLVAEGYVGDATPGFDGNPDRTLVDGDWSDDSTPHIQYDAPLEFIQRTLVARTDGNGNPVGPTDDRGALLDYFYGLKAQLQAEISDDPKPLEEALANFDHLKTEFDELGAPATCTPENAQVDDDHDGAPDDGCGDDDDPDRVGRGEDESGACTFGAGNTGIDVGIDVAYDAVACPAALLALGIDATISSLSALWDLATESLALALDEVVDAYLQAWVDDIDAGLQAWPEVGLGLTRALFDPAARRETQNEECEHLGADSAADTPRSDCEDAIGAVDVVFHELDPFINDHLLSMLGLPDVVGDLRELLSEAADALDDILGPALNPLRMVKHEITEQAKTLIKAEIDRRYGIDVDEIQEFLASPSAKMDVTTINITLPFVGPVDVDFYQPGDHARLDGYLGITEEQHHETLGGGLEDHIVFDQENFRAYRNTVVLAKLLLLDGTEMDRVLSDLTGSEYHLYGGADRGNVMLTPFPGAVGVDVLSRPEAAQQWLKLIDGDHAWRADGAPVFPADPSGGEGNFPLWESCVLREAGFRTLFRDWENGTDNFPDHGDTVSPDPNDPAAPSSTQTLTGTSAPGSGLTYVNDDAVVTVDATDGFWKPERIDIQRRVLDGDGSTVADETVADGDTWGFAGNADGTYTVETKAVDPCGEEAAHSATYVLDTAPPAITVSSPVPNGAYDTDDKPAINVSVTDAASGVANWSMTFDGATASNGQVLDMFQLQPGNHSVVVNAVDRVGNESSFTATFRLTATSASLLANVDRAFAEKLITKANVRDGLKDKLVAAVASHGKGQHATEWNQLGAVLQLVSAQRGKSINPVFADRLSTWVRDLISQRG